MDLKKVLWHASYERRHARDADRCQSEFGEGLGWRINLYPGERKVKLILMYLSPEFTVRPAKP